MTSRAVRVRGALVLLLSMPAVVWTAELLAGTPLWIVVGSATPAALLAAAILFAQRGSGRSAASLAFATAWGATVAAWLSTMGNERSRSWIDAASAGDDRFWTAVVAAPLIEEAAKAAGLLLLVAFLARGLRDARDGIVLGALVGIGFVLTENFLYLGIAMLQGGEAGLLRALFLRGVLGAAMHAVFTATAGAGLGWRAESRARGVAVSWRAPALGFLAAHLQHVAWNALAAPSIERVLCGAESTICRDAPTPLALFGTSTAITLAFLAPGIAALILVGRRGRAARGAAGEGLLGR
jgi:protease PrsW